MSRNVHKYYFTAKELGLTEEEVRRWRIALPENSEIGAENRDDGGEVAGSSCDDEPAPPVLQEQNMPVTSLCDERDVVRESTPSLRVTSEEKLGPCGSASNSPTETTIGWPDDSRVSKTRRYVSVHVLGQTGYCQRSAIQTFERGGQPPEENAAPTLTFLSNFEVWRIEEERHALVEKLAFQLFPTSAFAAIFFASYLRQSFGLFVLGTILFGWVARQSSDILIRLFILSSRLRSAEKAVGHEPEIGATDQIGIQKVNWWSLLKCGYEIRNYDQPFRHPTLPLEGCPWRVLERGNRRIPVIRAGGEKLGQETGDLFIKYQIQLAAYAVLLESVGDVEIPYGVVLPADSPNGLALSILPSRKKLAIEKLNLFIADLMRSQSGNGHPAAPSNSACSQCEFGAPEQIKDFEIRRRKKSGEPVLVMVHGNGNKFHSACGDRFNQAPPHAKTLRHGLNAAVE